MSEDWNYKFCTGCKALVHTSLFSERKRGCGVLRSKCRPCCSAESKSRRDARTQEQLEHDRAVKKANYLNNRDYYVQKNKDWYEKNGEALCERRRDERSEGCDKSRIACSKYHSKNSEDLARKKRERRAEQKVERYIYRLWVGDKFLICRTTRKLQEAETTHKNALEGNRHKNGKLQLEYNLGKTTVDTEVLKGYDSFKKAVEAHSTDPRCCNN